MDEDICKDKLLELSILNTSLLIKVSIRYVVAEISDFESGVLTGLLQDSGALIGSSREIRSYKRLTKSQKSNCSIDVAEMEVIAKLSTPNRR